MDVTKLKIHEVLFFLPGIVARNVQRAILFATKNIDLKHWSGLQYRENTIAILFLLQQAKIMIIGFLTRFIAKLAIFFQFCIIELLVSITWGSKRISSITFSSFITSTLFHHACALRELVNFFGESKTQEYSTLPVLRM